MANVFAILTAIVLAVSAFLAVKNSQAYFSTDPGAPGIVQQRQKQESIRSKQTTELADLQDTLGATTEERKTTEQTAEEQLTVLQQQQEKNKELEAKIESNKQTIATNQSKIDEMDSRLKEVGNIDDLVAGLRSDNAEIERLDAQIGEAQATLANLTASVRSTDEVIDRYKSAEKNYANKVSFFDSARIRSVFGNWGFVTLSAGNSAGVVQGSFLDVVRDGDVVGKLYVTAVESSSAAADIVPDSLKTDAVLRVGDRVVPTVKEATAPAAGGAVPATSPGAEAPAEEPAVDEPAFDEPATDEPATEEPAAEEAGAEPAAGEPAADDMEAADPF